MFFRGLNGLENLFGNNMFVWGFMDLYALQLKWLVSRRKQFFGQSGWVYLPSCAARRAYHRTCLAGRGWSVRCRTAQLFIYYPQPWVANFPIWIKRPFPDLIQPLYLQLLLRSLHFLAGWCWYTLKIMPHFINYYVYVVDMILARVNQNDADIGMLDCDWRNVSGKLQILSIWHCFLRDFC